LCELFLLQKIIELNTFCVMQNLCRRVFLGVSSAPFFIPICGGRPQQARPDRNSGSIFQETATFHSFFFHRFSSCMVTVHPVRNSAVLKNGAKIADLGSTERCPVDRKAGSL